MKQKNTNTVRNMNRRDSHLALGCAFGFALIVVAILIVLQLV